jgi:cell division septation protein DedD
MRSLFDEEDLEPVKPRRDPELTLGSGTLLAIFFGLVLLCGLCFGLGYALGHRESASAATPGDNAAQTAQTGSQAKPSAGAQTPAAPAANSGTAPSATNAPQASEQSASTALTAPPQTVPAGQPAAQAARQSVVQPASNGAQSQVRPALTTGNSGSTAATQANTAVHPALEPAGSFMVQIAAVSNQEDADVLSVALRKRGYTVNAKREPADNLIHVRIGPFATAAEANSWKNRLLNDGYNAIVQQ